MSTVTYTGILLALVATTAYNVGLIQEKRALGQLPTLEIRRVLRVIASLMTSRPWLAGFALMLLGLACQTIVLTFEPVSVVQPVLASFQLILLGLARFWMKEQISWVEALAALAIVTGISLVIAAAPDHTVVHPPASRLAPPLVEKS